ETCFLSKRISHQNFSDIPDSKIKFAQISWRISHKTSCNKFIVILAKSRLSKPRVSNLVIVVLFSCHKNEVRRSTVDIQIHSHNDWMLLLTNSCVEVLFGSLQVNR